MTKRIGFACKWVNSDGVNDPQLNFKGTTVSWLRRQSTTVVQSTLSSLAAHNLSALINLIRRVGTLPESRRMVRIGSEVLPVYTVPEYNTYWKHPAIRAGVEKYLALAGDEARRLNVRLSMHPGQFVVLASSTPEVVNSSIEEFEYHAYIAYSMGYGRTFQDFKINVHLSGQGGVDTFVNSYNRLSDAAKNCLTIENDEFSSGLDSVLEVSHLVPIVLDVHHYYIKEDAHIAADDPRIARVISSWRGVRPVIHYSQSKIYPDGTNLTKQKLRAHSDILHDTALNQQVKSHWEWADVMVEAKSKNIASALLAKEWGA